MAGETDFVDYDNFGIELEYKWQLDEDIQEWITLNKQDKSKMKRFDVQPSFRYRPPPTNRKDYL